MSEYTTEHPPEVYLQRIAQDMKVIRESMIKVVNYMIDAESEVPEKMRRFMNYMHDLHDIKYVYEEVGQPVPQWLLRDLERCDDRYRQLLNELHLDGAAFDKLRRRMAGDPENRWDHTRQITSQKEQS